MANLTFDFLHNYVTGERRASDPADAYQYDEGHVLEAVVPVAVASCEIQYWIRGMEKADAYTPTSITQNTDNTYTILGNIPNSYFETYGDLRVYIVVTDGDASITTYEGYIHIKERQMPEDYVDDDPDNEAVRVITEAQAAATTATEKAGEAAESAEQAQEILDSIPEDYSQLSEDVSNLKDDFHEYHSELGAGYADQLVSSIENTDQTPYNFRKVPYDATLEKVEGIVGVDVVLNQNAKAPTRANWNGYRGTLSIEDDVIALTVTQAVSGKQIFQTNPKTIPANHVVYADAIMKSDKTVRAHLSFGGTIGANVSVTAGTWTSVATMKRLSADSNEMSLYVDEDNVLAVDDIVYSKYFQLFDLTQMFGSQIADYAYSLEQSTAGSGVAWLKEHFPKIFDSGYVPYNAGTMVHVSGLSAHKTVGFNQWDEVAEAGTYSNTGAPVLSSSNIRSKNYIKIISGQAYYFKSPKTLYVTKYDSNYVCLGETGVINGVRTFDANVKYIRFCTGDTYGATYKHDICINLSDPTRNGTYEPYEAHEYPLDSTIDLHGILKLDANNNLYADGDVYPPSGQVQHRYSEELDLGTLTWHGFTQYANTFYADVPAKALNGNVVCTKYPNGGTFTDYGTLQDKLLYSSAYLGRVALKDTAYSSAEEIQTAMNGVYLVFEKLAPTTETAEPYTQTQICDPNGMEEYISDTVAPVGHVTKYPLDIAGKLDNILSMPTANGTYVLRATVNNGKVTYSWVSA